MERKNAQQTQEEFKAALEERQRRIQEAVEQEKRKIHAAELPIANMPPEPRRRSSHFENRLLLKQNPLFVSKAIRDAVIQIPQASEVSTLSQEKTVSAAPSFEELLPADSSNTVVQ